MTLTPERLTEKVLNDFLAFASGCFYIRDKQGEVHVLVPNVPQKELLVEAAKPRVRMVVVKGRQLGISTIFLANWLWRMLKNPNRNALILAQDKDTAKTLFESFKFAFRHLPDWLVNELGISSLYDTKQDLYMEHNGSTITISSAESFQPGRGRTLHYVHLSEAAFYPEARILTRALFAAVPKTGDTAIVIESTGNGPFGFFHDRYKTAKSGKSGYTAHFLPWFRHEEYRVAGARVADADDYEQNLLKLGATEGNLAWRRAVIASDYDGEVDDFKVEYPATEEEAFLSQAATVFDPVAVQKRAEEVRALRYSDGMIYELDGAWRWQDNTGLSIPSKYRVFKQPEEGRAYLIGADVGSGVGGPNSQKHSFSSADVVDAVTGEQVAHYHDMIEPALYAQDLRALGYYYNAALIAPEVTGGLGLQVNNALRDAGYQNLYRRKQFDTVKQEWTDMLGWNTSPRTKELIIGELRADFRTGFAKVNELGTLGEMLSFIRDPKKGTLGGVNDAADDRVMSLAIANHVRREYGGFAQAAADAAQPKSPESRAEWEDRVKRRVQGAMSPYSQPAVEDIGPHQRLVHLPRETSPRYEQPG